MISDIYRISVRVPFFQKTLLWLLDVLKLLPTYITYYSHNHIISIKQSLQTLRCVDSCPSSNLSRIVY